MKDYEEFFKSMEFHNVETEVRFHGDKSSFKVEELYQAFKARLIDELKVRGGSCQGVVSGRLENK